MLRPANKEELYNLRHASLRNVIERIFGILKRRFRILLLPPEYALDIQARIPSALSVIHNFITIHDPGESEPDEADEADVGFGAGDTGVAAAELGAGGPGAQGDAGNLRDNIAEAMWVDYQRIRGEREVAMEDSADTPSVSDEGE